MQAATPRHVGFTFIIFAFSELCYTCNIEQTALKF